MDDTIFVRKKLTSPIHFLETQRIPETIQCQSPILNKKCGASNNSNKLNHFSPRGRKELKSIDDLSFTFEHNEFSTPRVIKANHSLGHIPVIKNRFKTSTMRSQVKMLNNRRISVNLLLDPFPNF
ncbi:unnamed protein product [Blepharisma stoltei]|uniref:Uncharacterized protein n=1 Tax=Blepharisma stoltei TaxID=1481888 RepID=A0AAU9KCL8_9CILI|nr:unnamed protein product [Blepharisma stoltei]